MKTSIILCLCLFGLLGQIRSNVSKEKSTGIIHQEQLNDYDVNKKVILTPVSKQSTFFVQSFLYSN